MDGDAAAGLPCLLVPGLGGSGAEHWQTRWEATFAGCRRAALGDWDDPDRCTWVARLDAAVAGMAGTGFDAESPLLVAHSLGCLVVAWWAQVGHAASRVAGALLVTPPDVEQTAGDPRLGRFAPFPRMPLPLPAMLVASDDDPYATPACARAMAAAWAAQLGTVGRLGHINAASGLGGWEQGRRLLATLAARVRTTAPALR